MLRGKPAFRMCKVVVLSKPMPTLQYYGPTGNLLFDAELDPEIFEFVTITGHITQKHIFEINGLGIDGMTLTFACSSEEELDSWEAIFTPYFEENEIENHFIVRAAEPIKEERTIDKEEYDTMVKEYIDGKIGGDFEEYMRENGNEKGELTEEAFGVLFHKLVLSQLGSISQPLINFLTEAPANLPFEAAIKLTEKCLSKLDEAFPILTSSIFKLIDADNSGTLSVSEFHDIFGLIIQIGACMDKQVDPDAMWMNSTQSIVDALFRIFDIDHSGDIDASEVGQILGRIFSNVLAFIFKIISEILPYLAEGPLIGTINQLFDLFCQPGEEAIKIENISHMMMGMLLDDPLSEFPGLGLEEVRADADLSRSYDMLVETQTNKLTMILSGFKAYYEIKGHHGSKFMEKVINKFDEVAVEEELPLDQLADIITEIISVPVLRTVEGEQSAEMGREVLMAQISQVFPFPIPDSVNPISVFTEFTSAIVSEASLLLKGGSIKSMVTAILTMLDVNNDGTIDKDELTSLMNTIDKAGLDAIALLDEALSGESGLETSLSDGRGHAIIITVLEAILSIADENHDGELSKAEATKISRKIVQCAISWIHVVVDMLRAMTVGLISPLTKVLLLFKSTLVGGSIDNFTKADLTALMDYEISSLSGMVGEEEEFSFD